MTKRILVAVVCIPLIFVILYILPVIALPISLSVLSMIAIHEVANLTGTIRNVCLTVGSIIFAGIIPFWVYFGENRDLLLLGILIFITFIFFTAITSQFTVTLEHISACFMMVITVPYFLSSFLRLRMDGAIGIYLVLLPLVVAFTSDAFALFGGLFFGKHKLAPSLSPKKTVEGAIGGLIGAIVCTAVYGMVLQNFYGLGVNYFYLAIYGAFGSVISQIGDLSFSYIKREYGKKDFGKIFPGHGGILDRFDSVYFCAPLMEVFVLFIPALWVVG